MADTHARKRARHGDGGATGDIPDELLLEAFARLPGLQDLLRCGATCRQWRRLVTDRAFLRRLGHWPDTARRPSILAGIFSSQSTYPGGSGWRPNKKTDYCYKPPRFLSLQADGGGTRLTFDSFFAYDDDTLFDLARPLASRRGFLLVHVLLDGGLYDLHLAVCRPLVGRRSTRLLPPAPFTNPYSWDGCAILAGDEDGNLDHTQEQHHQPFQVLLMYVSLRSVRALTYSSSTGRWNAPVECCRPSGFILCGPQAGVVTGNGTVHWLFMDKANLAYYTFNIDVATSHVSFTEIPIKVHAQPPIPCITGEEGRLSFITIRGHGVVELWTKQKQYEDDEDGENGRECNGVWRCLELADLGSKRIDLMFFAESRGALFVGQQGVGFSIVDLKTKEKTLMHLNKKKSWYKRATRRFVGSSPVLYEMDWVFSRTLASSQMEDDIRAD